MTGADIVGALLRGHAPLVGMIPAASIKMGVLPPDVVLPALLLRLVSSGDRQPLKRGSFVRVTDRVSVSVRAASYREQRAAIVLIRAACAGRTGDIGGGLRVSILTAGKSPDLFGPNDTFEQAQDFRVSFDDNEGE